VDQATVNVDKILRVEQRLEGALVPIADETSRRLRRISSAGFTEEFTYVLVEDSARGLEVIAAAVDGHLALATQKYFKAFLQGTWEGPVEADETDFAVSLGEVFLR
jgi:hypothetical protein